MTYHDALAPCGALTLHHVEHLLCTMWSTYFAPCGALTLHHVLLSVVYGELEFVRVIYSCIPKVCDCVAFVLHMGSCVVQFYANLKAEVVKTEHHALRCFGFITHVEHAHPFTLMLGAQLGLHKDVLQYACNIINDSLRTTLCVQYKAEHIASAAIFLAARKYGCGLPETWWKACRVESEDLAHVCKTILELYTNEGGAESYTYIKLQSHFLDFTKGQIPDTSNSRGDTLKVGCILGYYGFVYRNKMNMCLGLRSE